MALACTCDVIPARLDRRPNLRPAVAVLAGLAGHDDWRVREAAAEFAHPDQFVVDPEHSDIRRGTLPVLHALATDPHPHVRAAAEWALDGRCVGWEQRRDHAPHGGGRTPHDPTLHADAAAGRAGSLPLSERAWLADGCAGTVPPELLADPICEVRLRAVYQADQDSLTDPIVTVLLADPCRYVRRAVLERVGPPAGFDLALLDEDGIHQPRPAPGTQAR